MCNLIRGHFKAEVIRISIDFKMSSESVTRIREQAAIISRDYVNSGD